MKIMLTGINSKYIHTNLAIRYLYQDLLKLDEEVVMKEYTINQHFDGILKDIYEEQPDVIGFSCYIWNVSLVHKLGRELKKVLPETQIILGGPEVSFEPKAMMEKEDYIDIIIKGEGEKVLTKLLKKMVENESYHDVDNIAFRVRGRIIENSTSVLNTFGKDVPFPYEGISVDPNKIYYYESTRGCPYNCEYCLSSTIDGVSFLPMKRIKHELNFFLDNKVKQVKFVDRTFNANKRHALAIMQYILENHNGYTNFHFEITAELIDEDFINFLEQVPKGMFQFEVGVQSTNSKTLTAINRRMVFSMIKAKLEALVKLENIHLHLDLIAGLPYEDYFSFRKSFNEVFSLGAEKLQLGFLKLLKGSELRKKAEYYGYIFTDEPPYEILGNQWIDFSEILKLKDIEELLEIYWNHHGFPKTMRYIMSHLYKNKEFKFFEDFRQYWKDNKLYEQSQGNERLYEILLEFCQYKDLEQIALIQNLLRFDYLKENKKKKTPRSFEIRTLREKEKIWSKESSHEFLQSLEKRQEFLPDTLEMPAKKLIKKVHFEVFEYPVSEGVQEETVAYEDTVILFDYEHNRAHRIK